MLAPRLLLRTAINSLKHKHNIARYSLQAGTASYDDDGKTKVSILNQETDVGLMINAFSQMGFRLSNGMMVIGPMAIFPRYFEDLFKLLNKF